ncbi:hypothetical protein RH915_02845 [Serpentinicella sp. ANB-PHB4]|uniref:putative ABC transporter permease subunit n=1 Tax=Serpentinicella sp. ANB-PHB4 TaxID=3074076 RepID=UPI00285646B5|nr:hypothetical protein [Serpentinicella sp. ANB-PHB4]MDR5658419.1 hypothetical protein [Serpentinicella sp. ANB-PHB4]
MNTLKLLYKNQWSMFINRYFRTRNKGIVNILIACGILGLLSLGVYFLNTKVVGRFGDFPSEQGYAVATVMYSVVFLLIFAFQFFASLLGLINNFYQSPDMGFLVSKPLNSGIILIYKLLNHTCNTIIKEAIFFVPVVIALSISVQANAVFYILMPLIYFMIATTAASIGVSLGILFLTKFSIKSYRYFVNTGNFLLTALVWVFIFFGVKAPSFIPLEDIFKWLFNTAYLYLIFPFISGGELLGKIALGASPKELVMPTLFLVGVTALIVIATYCIAKKYFYKGWMNSTPVEKVKTTNKKVTNKKTPERNLTPILCMVKYEWIRACKNFDIMVGSLVFYALYSLLVYFTIKIGSRNPLLFSALAMAGGIFLVTTGTSVPFESSEITKNPLTAKYQHSLIKFMPVSSQEVILSRIIMIFIPSIVILTIGLTISSIFLQLTLIEWIVIILIQIFITTGYFYMSQSVEMIYFQKYFESNKFIGGLISFLIIPAYLLLTIGLYVIYSIELRFLSNLQRFLNLPLIIVIAVSTVIVQITYISNIGKRAWDKMEF